MSPHGDIIKVARQNWLSKNNLDPEAELDPELWETMPREILRQYFRKHGIEDAEEE